MRLDFDGLGTVLGMRGKRSQVYTQGKYTNLELEITWFSKFCP